MTRAHVPGSIDACVDTRFMISSASYARQHTGSRRIARKLRRHNSRLKCSADGKFQAEYSLTPPPTEMMSLASNVQQTTKLALGVCSRITGKLVLGVCVLAPPASIGLDSGPYTRTSRVCLACILDEHRFGLDSRSVSSDSTSGSLD